MESFEDQVDQKQQSESGDFSELKEQQQNISQQQFQDQNKQIQQESEKIIKDEKADQKVLDQKLNEIVLKEKFAPKENVLHRRVESQGNFGTVLFDGPLVHEGKPAGSENQRWLGIEWDDESRGKHNGTVNGHVYFETKKGGQSGSLVKFEKVCLGIGLLDGVFKKYFRDNIPPELKQNILARMQNPDIDFQASQIGQNKENVKAFNTSIETDEEAYFETLRGEKKIVQFYGFEKIWQKLNNMKELGEISLYCVNISDLGDQGYLNRLLPNLQILSLEKNLLFSWHQIFQIGVELKNLKELQISSNRLEAIDEISDLKLIQYCSTNSFVDISPVGVFGNLLTLNLIDMDLSWKQICNILKAFPILENLILCRNTLLDYENIVLGENLRSLKFLNLENTCQQDFQKLKIFGSLPNLEKLILNQNSFKRLGKFEGLFQKVTSLSLEGNPIEDPNILSEISQFPELIYLNIKHVPISDVYGKSYVRQRSVAENPKLNVINGAILKKYERKDCEIFYLRKTFDEYFKLFNKVYYDYEFEHFKQWAFPLHPRIEGLIKVYGNPFEVEKNKQENNVESESVQKNIMLKITIVIAGGPLIGKENISKKFPDTTTVSTIRNVFSKLVQIPSDRQLLYYRLNKDDAMEKLDEDHKSLNFYGIKDESQIIVDMKDE